MGREVRRVVPNWNHPKHTVRRWVVQRQRYEMVEEYKPLYDQSYADAMREHQGYRDEWESEEHEPGAESFEDNYSEPDPEYYRPDWKPEEMTWYQGYETVSEGTPVTPPFETKEELIKYLATKGDFWDQHRGQGGWGFEAAEKYVQSE
jgi:hypothetical protein